MGMLLSLRTITSTKKLTMVYKNLRYCFPASMCPQLCGKLFAILYCFQIDFHKIHIQLVEELFGPHTVGTLWLREDDYIVFHNNIPQLIELGV